MSGAVDEQCEITATRLEAAWDDLDPTTQVDIAVRVRRAEPKLFASLCRTAKYPHDHRPRPDTVKRLFGTVWKKDIRLARSILVSYFVECRPDLNERFKAACREASLTEQASDPHKISNILTGLASHCPRDLVRLFEATLRAREPGWFRPSSDRHSTQSPSGPDSCASLQAQRAREGDAFPEPPTSTSEVGSDATDAAKSIEAPAESLDRSPVVQPPCERRFVHALSANVEEIQRRLEQLDQLVVHLRHNDGSQRLDDLPHDHVPHILELAGHARTAIQTFRSCPSSCSKPAVCTSLRATASADVIPVESVVGLSGAVRSLAAATEDAVGRVTAAWSRVRGFRAAAGDPPGDPPESAESLFALLAQESWLASEEATAQLQLQILLARQREECTRLLAELERVAHRRGAIVTVSDLRSALERVSTPIEIAALMQRIQKEEQEIRSARNTSDLARELGSECKLDKVTELLSLLGANRAAVAAVLATLVQAVHSTDLLIDGDSHAFMRQWVSTLIAAARHERVRDTMPELLARSWLPSLKIQDLPADALLPIQLLALAAARRDRSSQVVAFAVDAFAVGERPDVPTLARLARYVRHEKPMRLVDQPVAARERDAEAALERALAELFLPVSRKNGRVAQPVIEKLKPCLEGVFEKLRSAPRPSRQLLKTLLEVEQKLIEKTIATASESHDSSTYFRKQFGDEIREITELLERYADARAAAASKPAEISRADLQADLAKLAAEHPAWSGVFGVVEGFFESDADARPLEHLVRTEPQLVCLSPQLALQVQASADWMPDSKALQLLLSSIAVPPRREDALHHLAVGYCHDALAAIAEEDGDAETCEVERQRARDMEAGLASELSSLSSFLGPDGTENARRELALHHFGYVVDILDDARRRRTELDRETAAVANAELSFIRSEYRHLLDRLDESTRPDDWKDQVRTALHLVLVAVSRAVSPDRVTAEKVERAAQLKRGIELFRDIIEFGSLDLAAIDVFVDGLSTPPTRREVSRGDALEVARDATRVRERQAAWFAFEEFARSPAVHDKGRGLLHAFMKLNSMYCDGDGASHKMRFVVPANATLLAAETEFHKPGSAYFDRPVRVQLLQSDKLKTEQVDALRKVVEAHRESLTHIIVLVAGDVSYLRKELAREVRQARITLIDRDAFRTICEAKSPGGPLRRALMRTMTVEHSPFKSEGHVSRERDLYVGRREIGRRVVDGRCWAVWGGRRSGKTSLLHAAEDSFKRRKECHSVVYESLEAAVDVPLDEVDLYIARQIARGMGWEAVPSSLDEFAAHLERQCRETPTCILLDEMDAYIAPYFTANRHDYPLIRHLRRLRNKFPDRLVCVFAGFRLLYRAMRVVKRPDDTSYPWQNWLEAAPPLSRLSSTETSDLVREGFEEILGMELEAIVPHRVFKLTGGQPASVQQFCNRILHRIAASARSDAARRVTEADVDATYAENTAAAGDQTYIRFFDSTLAMNLGPLERIIVYVIAAVLIGRHGDAERRFSRGQIKTAVSEWFGVQPPTEDAFDAAFGYLEMTGMLEPEGDRVKMTFPCYVEILLRLEEANRDQIERLVRQYVDTGGLR